MPFSPELTSALPFNGSELEHQTQALLTELWETLNRFFTLHYDRLPDALEELNQSAKEILEYHCTLGSKSPSVYSTINQRQVQGQLIEKVERQSLTIDFE
jgi:hypothetical protein